MNITSVELYHKLKDYLRVLDFGGDDRGYLLKTGMVIFNTYSGNYRTKHYRFKNIGRTGKLLYWSQDKTIGKTPTYEQFCRLYDLEVTG